MQFQLRKSDFQAWIEEQIIESKQQVAEELDFSFLGANAANEAGHVANMTNQMRLVLHDIRTEILGIQVRSNFRIITH